MSYGVMVAIILLSLAIAIGALDLHSNENLRAYCDSSSHALRDQNIPGESLLHSKSRGEVCKSIRRLGGALNRVSKSIKS
jgi:hypothetical protein